MKRSFAILLALLMSLNSAAAVYAEDGTEIMISADEEIIMEEIPAEEFGDAEVIEVSDAAELKAALETVYEIQTTIRLTGNILDLPSDITIPGDGAPIILDMNGCTLGTSEDWAGMHWMIVNWGNLTITGEGQFTLGEGVGIAVNNVGTLTIESGTFSGYTPIYADSGTLTVKGGTFNAEGEGSQPFGLRSGTIEITGDPVCSGDTLFGISDTKFDLTIKGGTYTASSGVFYTMEEAEGTPEISIEGGSFTMGESAEALLAALEDYIAGGATVTVNDMTYTKDAIPEDEPAPEGEKLEGALFGSDYWGMNDPEVDDRSYNMAFDGDISTFYDAVDPSPDYHVGMDVGTPTQLTEVHIVPRNDNGYEPQAIEISGPDGYYPGEDYTNLFDGDLESGWCTEFNGESMHISWQTEEPVYPDRYILYTGYDTAEQSARSPITWTLFATNDPEGGWDRLDYQENNYELPDENCAPYEVLLGELPSEEGYRYFKLAIDAVKDSTDGNLQLGEIRLLEAEPESINDCIRMDGMTVQGSADGENWADLYTFSGDYWTVKPYVVTAEEMELVNDYSFTQFRVINKEQHFNVAEVEFYGLTDSDLPLYVYEEDEPEPAPEGEKLSGEIYGSDSWESNEDTTFDKAFDGDISTFYDAYGATIEAHVSMDVGKPTRLTEVYIVPRNVNGYDPEVTVLDHTDGFENEEADKLFDRTLDSKWCAPGAEHSVTWETDRPIAVHGYRMYTANDNSEYPGRNPITWKLYGSNDPETEEWELIDEQSENYDIPDGDLEVYEVFLGEETTGEDGEPVFEPVPSPEYRYFRLDIEAVEDAEDVTPEGEPAYIFQLSEFRLLESEEECLRMEGMTVQGSADGQLWADLYTFPEEHYFAQEYVITADDMPLADSYSFTQFRVINRKQHFNVAEVEFYGVDGSEMIAYPETIDGEHNLLATGEPYGSEAWDEDTTFDKVFDGDTDTYYDAYEGSGRDAELGIVLGTPAQLTGFRVHSREYWEGRMANLTVQGSVNGDDWITLYQFDDIRDYGFEYYEVTSDMLASAAHEYAFTQFRVINKTEHLNVAEVEFYGTYNHDLESFPIVIEEPIYSYLTAEQFLNTAWVYYERDPENPDDDHYLDHWYFNDLDEEGMSRFDHEFAGRNPVILIGGVGFDNSVVNLFDIGDMPVVAVAPLAFAGEKQIVEVVVNWDSECRYILGGAFADCDTETVTVSNSLRRVDGDAFRFNERLHAFIKADGDLTHEELEQRDWAFVTVGDSDELISGEWLVCYPPAKDPEESYRVPDSIYGIEPWAFWAAQLDEITMGHNVGEIRYGAFSDSTASTIILSPALRYLGNEAFAGCTNLTYLEIPSDKVEIDSWENEYGETEYNDWIFGGTVDYERDETRVPLKVVSYEGGMIEDYINYIHILTKQHADYDMSHVVFEATDEVIWYGFDWWGECGENEVFLVGYSAPFDAEITTMPTETYDGKTIIGIRADGGVWSAFHDDPRVGGEAGIFTIPEGIRYICDAPFGGCENLRTLILPESLEDSWGPAFAYMYNLEKFEVSGENANYWTTDDGMCLYHRNPGEEVIFDAFALANDVDHVEVAEGTNVIGSAAFYESKTIKTVTLPESLYAIDWHAFQDSALESITIPANVDRIMPTAFAYCPNLTDVKIERLTGEFCNPENWHDQDFSTVFEGSENVTVYVYEGTDAHRAAEEYGWNYVTRDLDVTCYDTYVANDGVHLRSVLAKPGETVFEIPEDVQVIDDCAFAGIEGIEKVVFPKNLRYIGHEAFAGCGEFEIVFSGAVPIYWEGSSFDEGFNVEELYNIAFYWNQAWDGEFLYYVAPDAKEAMVRGYWYTAIDNNGVMEIPATLEWDGEIYTVTAIEPNACRPSSPEGIYNHLTGEAGGMKLEIEERDEWTYEYPKHIVLPDTIRYIGDGAFRDQTYDRGSETQHGLMSIDLPAAVQYIDPYFVVGCWDIEAYTGLDDIYDENSSNPYRLAYGWNENGEEVGVVVNTWNEIVLHAYPQGRSDSEFITPAGIEVIGMNAFRDAYALDRVNLTEGDSVRRIENEAFAYCVNLERLMISTNLEHIEHAPFQGCDNFTTFDIPYGSNYFFMHEDGTLRTDDGGTIAVIPLGNIPEDGVLRISDDVHDIRAGAAASSGRLTELIIPASVRNIYDCAFEDCWNLRKVTIEGTLDYLHLNTFKWCQNLEIIVYHGDTLNIHYYRGDDEYIKVERDENGDVIWNDDGSANRIKFDIICLNPECEVNLFIVDNYDYENGEREYLDAYDNEFFNLYVGATYFETYHAYNGIHLAKAYNVGSEVVIPEDVMVIDDEAFAGIEGIESVVFPKNLREIRSKAFAGCGEFEVITTGGVQIGWVEDAFDFDFEKVYNEKIFDHPVLIDGILYRFPHNREITEAMVVGWWYEAVDENGVLTVPDTVTYGGIPYDVVSIQGDALSEGAPRDCYEMGWIELDNPVYKDSEADSYYAEGDDFLLGGTDFDLELDYDHYWTYPTSIVVGKNVRYIGWGAFAGHGYWNEEEEYDFGLESVTLPAELHYLDEGAFWDSYQISEFKGLDAYGDETSDNPYRILDGAIINVWKEDETILQNYPPECANTEYTVSGEIETILWNSFRWAETLQVLTLEEGVDVIKNHAFMFCTDLHTVNLPASLRGIEDAVFSCCYNLTTINLAEGSETFQLYEDGTLRADDGETLILYPVGTLEEPRVLHIPDGIREIACAGLGGMGFTEIHVPASVERINYWAFECNDTLEKVVIHGTIEQMNMNVFAEAANLKEVVYYGDYIHLFYEGSEDEYVAIAADGRKFDFVLVNENADISYSIQRGDNPDDRDYDTYYPDDNPHFSLIRGTSEEESVLGDINGDGEVDTFDRMILARTLAEWPDYPSENLDPSTADINGDGEVDTLDRMILARYLAEWPGYETLEQFRQ